MKLIFAGTPAFPLPCLQALYASDHELIGVYTQPDRPAGRGQKALASPIKTWAIEHKLPVYQPVNFKEKAALDTLASLKPDLMIVIAYGLILPESVLAIPRYGCINVHASLLPKYRGAAPIHYAILKGETETGVTIMQMDQGMDTGAVLNQVTCNITSKETSGSLHDKLATLAIQPLLETIKTLSTGIIHPVAQDHDQATYAAKINKQDACIDWTKPAVTIDCLIRAYNPWPIAFTHVEKQPIRIHKARVQPAPTTAKPGTLLSLDKTGIFVATGDDILVIETLQFPGGKVLSVQEYLNGHKHALQVNCQFT